jgi:hypothetical protein
MLSEKESKVLRFIDDNQGELIKYLRQLISFKTVTPASGGKAEGDDYKEKWVSPWTCGKWMLPHWKISLARELTQEETSVICLLLWENSRVKGKENP